MLLVRRRFAEEVQWPNQNAMVATSTVKAKANEGIWEPDSLDKGVYWGWGQGSGVLLPASVFTRR